MLFSRSTIARNVITLAMKEKVLNFQLQSIKPNYLSIVNSKIELKINVNSFSKGV
jgi:hypothetical protein